MLFLGLKVLDLHHSCIKGYATGITYHSKLSNAPLKTLLNIKLSVFYIVVYLCKKPVYMYVLNFNDRVFFLHILSDDCIVCRVIFSEYYFKDHFGNKCMLVCFNVSSLVRLHACSLIVCHVFL